VKKKRGQMINLKEMGQSARQAARYLAVLDPDRKNLALITLADLLVDQTEAVLTANAVDIQLAEEAGLTPALIDRLRLSAPDWGTWQMMCAGGRVT
jgi:glutamate-5-semialdehyde dehydrogenase